MVSDFTEDDGGVHLVDLDHFSDTHSLYYQVGFVVADVDVVSGLALAQDVETLWRRCDEYSSRPEGLPRQEELPLLVGYMSRLGIDIINAKKELDSYRSQESLKNLLLLAGGFLKG